MGWSREEGKCSRCVEEGEVMGVGKRRIFEGAMKTWSRSVWENTTSLRIDGESAQVQRPS